MTTASVRSSAAWGGTGKPLTHLQVYTGLIDAGFDLQAAIEAPRWLSRRFPEATYAELARRGHQIHRWPPWHEAAGHVHGITIDPETGVRLGAADPRSDGAAVAQTEGAAEEIRP